MKVDATARSWKRNRDRRPNSDLCLLGAGKHYVMAKLRFVAEAIVRRVEAAGGKCARPRGAWFPRAKRVRGGRRPSVREAVAPGARRDHAGSRRQRRRDPSPHDALLYGCVQFCFAQAATFCSAVRSFDWVNTWTADCSAAACDAVGT